MKNVVILAVVAVGAWVGIQFAKTGELSLLPGGGLTEEARAIADLEDRFEATLREVRQAGRTAGLSGLDTSSDVERARREVVQIEKELERAAGTLTDPKAESMAAALETRIAAFRKEYR